MTVRTATAARARQKPGCKQVSARTWPRAVSLLLVLAGLFLASGTVWAQGNAAIAGAGPWPRAALWIVNPWATVALLAAGCLLLYHDLLTPTTWGVTGTLGVVAVGLVFAAHITVGGFGWVGVVLMLLGLAAVLWEVHVLPGHGLAFAGFLLMFAGMFISLGGTQRTAFALSVTLILIMVSGLAFLAYLPKSPAWQKLGDQMHRVTPTFSAPSKDTSSPLAVGASGRTLTALRPFGRAEFAGSEHAVVTEGDFLEAGERVVVSEVKGERVVVEAVSASAASLKSAGGVTTAG